MIESPRNTRVREVRRLAQKAERVETGLFLLEGPQAVREALRFRPDLIEEFFITPTALERYPELSDLVHEAELDILFASEEAIAAMADTKTPQGVVAVCRQFPVSMRSILDGSPRLVAILEEVRDPGNAGTVIRAADAAGADAVILSGRAVDLYNPKVVRSTTGSLFHIPVAIDVDLATAVSTAKAAGLTVRAADVKGGDLPLVPADEMAAPTAWLFGNEARGLEDDALRLADAVTRVPIYGEAESMNLATAASVCLYASAFAQRAE